MDFYPTILDLIGAKSRPQQHMDGVSLLPVLMGNEISERSLFWHYPHYGNQGGDPSTIIRSGDWKMIHYYEDGLKELYNLKNDPTESEDFAAKHPEVLAELAAEMEAWLTAVNADFPQPDPQFNEKLWRDRQAKIVSELLPRLEQRRKDYLSKDFDPENE